MTDALTKDPVDLYDHEIVELGKIVTELIQQFAHKTASLRNLEDLKSVAQARFLEIGLIIEMDTLPLLAGGSPQLTVIGRVDTPKIEVEDGHALFDHERKRFEVVKANERGEKFLGQKEPADSRKPRKKS